MSRTIRIASCSVMPAKWDKAGNCEKMLDFMRRAVDGSPELVMFPEGCLEGYVVMEAIEQGRGDEMVALAEPEDGPSIARFRAFCRENRVNALVGFAERVGNEAYNTALWIGRDGKSVGKYRKTHLAEGYVRDHRFNRTGEEIRAFDTDLGRVGAMICFDRRVPEVARSLMLDGAEVLLNPSYGFYRGVNDAILQARAHENGLPLVFCHPSKTVVCNWDGGLVFFREETDVISHVTVDLVPGKADYWRKSRRPEIYGKLVEPLRPRD